MDAFWPEAAPSAARNSLNVAMHGLRRAFRDSAGVQPVVLEDGTYRLGPGLRLWLDVTSSSSGRSPPAAWRRPATWPAPRPTTSGARPLPGGLPGRRPLGGLADDHQGGPAAGLPGRPRPLTGLFLDQDQLGACVALSRYCPARPVPLLADRRLMRCRTREGQPDLALRQYQACPDALHHGWRRPVPADQSPWPSGWFFHEPVLRGRRRRRGTMDMAGSQGTPDATRSTRFSAAVAVLLALAAALGLALWAWT